MKTPIQKADLTQLASDRYEDAKALHNYGRYDGSIYMCGYVVELALKNAIATTLGWQNYPPSSDNRFAAFFSHDLELLLTFSGKEALIKLKNLADWSIVSSWNPGMRYTRGNAFTKQEADVMLLSTQNLRNAL
ncbi:MAG TPA: HEPN domain-containing protein [Candidatus Saccharimonadales bacterium]|nr:HEPN domain-containing protein [Candidatus Saccharimonadales bacterium]